MDTHVYAILAHVEGKAFWGAVVLIFISLQLSNSPLYLLLLWCAGAGLLVAYTTFRVLPRIPNLLLHKPHPPHLRTAHPNTSPSHYEAVECPVCNQPACRRHGNETMRDYLHPWDHMLIPSTVDCAMTEFLEIVLQRFVYSWHRQLAPSAESFEDELRTNIRFAVACLLRRAQKLDIPHIVTRKLLQAIAAHIHMCNTARRRLPLNASMTEIEAAVIKEYGGHLHTAMRGSTGNSRYFRHLTQSLMPLLLPESAMKSKIMCSFIQELFTNKIFMPAMNFVAKPDFLNKLLLIVFDKNSRLERTFGPQSKNVLLLARFANRRYSHISRPLEIPLKQLLKEQDRLYTFMQFMKARNALHVLQVYLTLDDLKERVNNCSEVSSLDALSQVEILYRNHLLPSSYTYLPLDTGLVGDLTTVLIASDTTPMTKCAQMKAMNVFGRIRGHIYHELLSKIYYPQFSRDYQFFETHISGRFHTGAKSGGGRTGDKWRQKTSQLSLKFRLKSSTPEQNDTDGETGRESPSSTETTPTGTTPTSLSVPTMVQVVDTETLTDGMRPYTLYFIVTTRKDDEGKSKTQTVKRRFKEFISLDAKLRHFHGQICPSLPSKRTFRNLDKSFIDTRVKELCQYLEALIVTPGVREGQVLASFLSDASDPTLFMPDTVGDKAGKMIKSVPSRLKREKTGPYIEELLQNLLQTVESPPTPQTSGDGSVGGGVNRENGERYIQQQYEDISDSEATHIKPWLHPPSLGAPVHIGSVMDILVFVAMNVYQVSPPQLTVLMLANMLGQDSIESLVYNFVAGRVELMESETKIVQLIHLLRDNLFRNKDPPRTEADVSQRFQDTIDRLFTYPHPLIVQAIGEQRYREGTARIFEGLQCRELNKQLFFQLLDIIILELFPELEQKT